MATKKPAPSAKKPAAKKPAAKKPAAKKPVAKKPTTKAVAKKPAVKKPAATKTVAKKPAVKKAATTKTTTKAKAPAKKTTAVTTKLTPKPKATAKPSTAVQKKNTAKATVIPITAKKTGKKSSTDAKSSPDTRVGKTPAVSSAKTGEASAMSNALDVRELDFAPYKLRDEEEYMNTTQLEHFRKILLGWKQVLMEQVDATVSHMQNEPGNLADPNDCATREEEFNLELRTRDRERQLIKKIESTLQQIKQNEYGYCTQCGEEIGVRRLEARPTANLCIDCKTLAEIREKHYSS